jgi:hypothetical protein
VTLRVCRVLKPGPTNGRYFFSCANGKGSGGGSSGGSGGGSSGGSGGGSGGCGLFSWDTNHPRCWDVTAAPVTLPL